MKKIALFAFNGDPICFVHVLLNALDLQNKGHEVVIVMEGAATKLAKDLDDPKAHFSSLYQKTKDAGLIHCICHACASTMGVLDYITEKNLPVCAEMMGHPSMADFIDKGYEIITF